MLRLGFPFLLIVLLVLARPAAAQLSHNIPSHFCLGSPDTVTSGQRLVLSGDVTRLCIRVESGGVLEIQSNTTLTTDMIFGLPGSSLEGGTAAAPLVNVRIRGRSGPFDAADPEQWGRGLLWFGRIRLHGTVKPSFARATNDLTAGLTQLPVALPGTVAGDRILMPGTSQEDPKAGIEVRTAASSAPSTVALQAPLQSAHPAAHYVDGTVFARPHVANLTRSIVIESESPTAVRWHVAFVDRADVDIRYVAFVNLGRTRATEPTSATNQIGRYPLHLHHLLGPPAGQPNGRQWTLIGNVIERGSKWGVTIHGTHYGLAEDNVIYRTGGAGIMGEDGSETENLIRHNLIVDPTGPTGEDIPEDLGRQQSGLWFRGPHNRVVGNVVANVDGNAVSYMHGSAPRGMGSIVSVPAGPGLPPSVVVDNRTKPILEFTGNTFYASRYGLIVWDVLAECCTTVYEGPESRIAQTTVWHIDKYGLFPYATNRLRVEDWTQVGDPARLSEPTNWPAGFVFADYLTRYITLQRVRLENLAVGYELPVKHGDMRDLYGSQAGTTQILDSVFRNVYNLRVAPAGAVTGGGVNLPPRRLDTTRLTCGTVTADTGGRGQKCVRADYDLGAWPNVNLIQSSRITFTDLDGRSGDSFDLFTPQQAAGFVVPQTGSTPGLIGSPDAGRTNAQNWAAHGIAINAAVAPCATTRTGFDGFVCGITPPPPTDPDSDGDGILDSKDKCPTVPAPGTADGCPAAPPQVATITLNPSQTFQTWQGWEVVFAGNSLTAAQIAPQLDLLVNDLGYTRARLEIHSGTEGSGGLSNYNIINDNNDPNVINPAGFNWTTFDSYVESLAIPFRQRVLVRGEQPYINLNYVDFKPSTFEHYQNPAEYAEFMLAVWQHMQGKYGWVPNAIEVILEPNNSAWRGTEIGRVVVATAQRFQAAGLTVPDFIIPSTSTMDQAPQYIDETLAVSGSGQYVTEFSYHRYGGQVADLQAIAARSVQHSKRASMLENWGSGGTTDATNIRQLHEDLTVGRNSAWQAGAAVGPACTWARVVAWINNAAVVCENPKILRQYTKYIRPGDRRIGASSTNGALAPVAFVRPDGGYVVVVKAEGGSGSFSVGGLPAGTYALSYAANGQWNVSLPDVTVQAGQNLSTSIPGDGVLTMVAKAGAPPPPQDTTPPTTAVGVPPSPLAGTVTVTATCTDNVACVLVRLEVDGAGMGNDSTLPYTFSVSTLGLANGPHTFRVVGRDVAGNEGVSADETRVVDNTPPPPADTDGDGVLDVDDKCPTQPGPASNGGCPLPPPSQTTVTTAIVTCRVTLAGPPPDQNGGWTARIRNAVTNQNIGTSDSTGPTYEPGANLSPGAYSLRLRWTKSGQDAVLYPAVAVTVPPCGG